MVSLLGPFVFTVSDWLRVSALVFSLLFLVALGLLLPGLDSGRGLLLSDFYLSFSPPLSGLRGGFSLPLSGLRGGFSLLLSGLRGGLGLLLSCLDGVLPFHTLPLPVCTSLSLPTETTG